MQGSADAPLVPALLPHADAPSGVAVHRMMPKSDLVFILNSLSS
jgi:hypothetical protein